MPVTVARTYKLSTNGGQVIYMSETEAQTLVVDETRLTLVCDSPRCKARHGAEEPTTRSWCLEDEQKGLLDKVPDDANRFIPVENKKVVCSRQCLKDWAEYAYVRPPTVKELRARMEEDKKVQAEELKNLNPHLIKPEEVQTRTEETGLRAGQEKQDSVEGSFTGDDGNPIARGTFDTETGIATPAIEVPALCQQDEEGYGHGV